MNNSILNGYRVLDLTDETGMLCTGLLAGMGAEVIRLEKPGCRVSPATANAGKHHLTLDIETPSGRNIFRRLIKTADVLAKSYPPGYLASLGLGYDELKSQNPRLIMVSISPFGQTGPWRDYRSSDIVNCALGGPLSVCGEPDRPPLNPFGNQSFAAASLFAANGVLLAIFRRHASNQGQFIDISIHECLAATLDHVLVRYFYEGVTAGRQGSLYWNKSFNIFRCKDGYILLSLSYQWETLVEWLAAENMAGDLADERWRDEAERQNNIDHIIEVLGKWTAAHTVDELLETGQLMRFPWGKVSSIPQVVNNPQLLERGFFTEQTDSETGRRFLQPGAPVKMGRSPWLVSADIPQPGEYNRKIYLDELRLTETEFDTLKKSAVI